MAKLTIINSAGTFREPNVITPTTAQKLSALAAVHATKLTIINSAGTYSAIIDTTPPTAVVTINNGASSTNQQNVTINITSSTAVDCKFSNDNQVWSAWQVYAPDMPWTLSGGEGPKTIYVQLRNASGVASTVYATTVIYDTVAPSGLIKVNTQSGYIADTHINLLISADSGSGSVVSSMRFSNDDATWSVWQSYATSSDWIVSAGDGTKTIYAQFRDAAGNTSLSASTTVELFTAAVNVSIDSHPANPSNNPVGTFTFSSTTPNVTFQVQVDSGAIITAASPYTTAALVNGTHTFTVTAVHASGKKSAPQTFSWAINSLLVTATLSGVPADPSTSDSASITVGGTGVVAYKYRINSGSWSAETPVATTLDLSSLSGNQYLEVIGKTSAELWQVVPTIAIWNVVTRVFDTSQTFGFDLSAEIINYPLFESSQTFSYDLSASDTPTGVAAEFAANLTFGYSLTAEFPDGTPAKEFYSAQTFTFGLLAQVDFTVGETVTYPPFESAQTFTFDIASEAIMGEAFEAVQSFGFNLSASFMSANLFDSNHDFGFSLYADVLMGEVFDSAQTFGFSLESAFVPFQQFDSVQTFSFGIESYSYTASTTANVFYCLNTKTLNGVEYTNFAFNSMARQGKDLFLLGSTGINKHTGSKDLTVDVTARLVSGISDFGKRNKKYFPDAHIFMRGEGRIELSVITDETSKCTYEVIAREGQQGAHTKRVKLARGASGRSAQLELTNIEGSDFDLQEIQLNYELSQRS